MQNKNNITSIVTESYEEWDIVIQKLIERNSHQFDSDQVPESGKDPARKE